MTCREFADFMMDYVSGELPADVRERFDHHLSICVNCERYLAGYRETIALGRRAFDDLDAGLPPDVPDQLIRSILDARKR